jgi:Leucine-rich repeat (LRR) protein
MTLPSLTMLDFAANRLTAVPFDIRHATALRWVHFLELA